MREDFDGIENDKRVLDGGEGGLTFVSSQRPCPAPCRFPDGMTCSVCRKRKAPYVETRNLLEVSTALMGGMPLERHEASFDVWVALGELKKRNDAVTALQGMV